MKIRFVPMQISMFWTLVILLILITIFTLLNNVFRFAICLLVLHGVSSKIENGAKAVNWLACDWWHSIVIYFSSRGRRLHFVLVLHLVAPYNRGCLQPPFLKLNIGLFHFLFVFVCKVLKNPNLACTHLAVKLQSNATNIFWFWFPQWGKTHLVYTKMTNKVWMTKGSL